MNIAIIGTGNVGGALATNWSKKGHTINLGVQNVSSFKGIELLKNNNTKVFSISEAVAKSEVILIAVPPTVIFEIIEQLGDVSGKIIIDATNSVRQAPDPYKTVYHCLADKTKAEIVKCFNSTGFENMLNPVYNGEGIDMFMAGDSEKAKSVATQLALDAGFGSCLDFGKADKVELLEKFALSWINLAIMQGQGRNIAFKVVRR
ncbi:NADPH-dependent F420 reductase [Flavihumibacter profundi]|uniref:NADPH-dependent F420 reductase n=1 Tax=Flavihumibacter profundi TaxID=2716883 RepID=UPI001CC4C1C9|nr:NAD(P)-binding domain-containing protein [Flavihumibacter profundi]MBZ5856963.1 NAD(P)-binding domain-containing protein [Flavihumibacter profundi]